MKSLDALTIRELKKRIGETAGPTFPLSVSSGTLEILVDAYLDRAALILVNANLASALKSIASESGAFKECTAGCPQLARAALAGDYG